MALIEWTPSLSVEIKSIDEQHKKLFSYINDLYDALTEKKEKEILSVLFKNLEDYTQTHFTLEEANFDKFHFDGKDAHIMQHKMFVKKLSSLKEGILKEIEDPEELLFFLVDWLKNHIKIVDHEYVDCFHKNGLF